MLNDATAGYVDGYMSDTTGRYTNSSRVADQVRLAASDAVNLIEGRAFCAEMHRQIMSGRRSLVDYGQYPPKSTMDTSYGTLTRVFAYLAVLVTVLTLKCSERSTDP